eukprot:302417-Pelagomonas_calceolata.AAC.1
MHTRPADSPMVLATAPQKHTQHPHSHPGITQPLVDTHTHTPCAGGLQAAPLPLPPAPFAVHFRSGSSPPWPAAADAGCHCSHAHLLQVTGRAPCHPHPRTGAAHEVAAAAAAAAAAEDHGWCAGGVPWSAMHQY